MTRRTFNHPTALVCMILIPCLSPGQDFNKGGRTAFQFLKIGVGARQVALGEACIANVRDVNSAFWDPAGLSGVSFAEASVGYTTLFADLRYYTGAAAVRWAEVGVFALSYASLDYGDIPEALVSGQNGSSDTRTGSTFSGSDLMVGFSFSREFTDHLSIGGTVKLLREQLFNHSVSLTAFDVGTFYNTGFNEISLAMTAQNFAGSVKWLANSDREEGYDIPLIFRIGTSVSLIGNGNSFIDLGVEHAITVTFDAVHTNDYAERFHLGAEYTFSDVLTLRGGYKFNYEEGNASFGVGLQRQVSGINVRFDYAFVSFQHLESPHRLTVILGF
ncbi:MAG: PorV/PorQ family protein [Ignavibacteriales bacterium]|nr:PorV/PorQ family protein [Ignavibacteriales bacterium]